MVRAVGQNGYKDSAVIVSTINNKGAQIAIVGEYDNWMQLTYNPQRSQFEGANGELMYFAGREKAVAEFDEHSSNDLNATYTVKTAAELNKFRQLAYSKKTLLYRDGRGRKIFGNIMTRFTINEERKRYTISFTFSETDYNEVV
jgi:hypothetical protein